MARTQGKKGLIITIIVLVIVLLLVGTIVVVKHVSQNSSDTSTNASKTATTATKTTDTTDTSGSDTSDASSTSTTNTSTATADPETLASVDVAPLGVTVFYTKGTPGFDFAVKKTTANTQYVEFTSTDLVGTKCTDDDGSIASIIKNPTSTENQATISQTVKIGSDSYGLSLASAGCTSDADLLTQYQTGFKDGFSSLKAL